MKLLISYMILFLIAFPLRSLEDRFEDEYKLKSIYIYKISKQVDWNREAIGEDFVIRVYQDLDEPQRINIPSQKKIANKNIKLIYTDKLTEISKCNVLFISSSKIKDIEKIHGELKDKRIITFGDDKRFADLNIMFSFVRKESDELSFIGNMKPVKSMDIKIDPRIYTIADKVIND